jgi:acetyl-CoA carboxylase biotin carboxyl carrier protein
VSSQNLTYRDLLQIIELIKSSSQFGEFHLKTGDLEVHLRRHGVVHQPASTAPAQSEDVASAAAVPTPSAHASPVESSVHQRHGHAGGSTCVTEAAAHSGPLGYPESALLIRSPMVGTFYRAPEPGAKPFVEVGQMVEPDTIVCIIEVMKLMNSMPARYKGVVTHILVEDAEPVEYGQVLIVIDPNADDSRCLQTDAL